MSAEERADTLSGAFALNGLETVKLAEAIRAAEVARDSKWREAVQKADLECVRVTVAAGDPCCKGCAPLRALLASNASAPTAPLSASGALAGSEELTPKEKK